MQHTSLVVGDTPDSVGTESKVDQPSDSVRDDRVILDYHNVQFKLLGSEDIQVDSSDKYDEPELTAEPTQGIVVIVSYDNNNNTEIH